MNVKMVFKYEFKLISDIVSESPTRKLDFVSYNSRIFKSQFSVELAFYA